MEPMEARPTMGDTLDLGREVPAASLGGGITPTVVHPVSHLHPGTVY